MVKNIAKDGSHKLGRRQFKMSDFQLAQIVMEASERHQKGPGPSDDLLAVTKAMDSGETGFGAELINTEVAQEIWQDFFQASRVVDSMDMVLDEMPSDPFPIPFSSQEVVWRKGTANVPTTGTNVDTGKATLQSTEVVAEVDYSYSLDEDAVIAMMPSLRSDIERSGAEKMDDFALNADKTSTATGNINSDDAVPPEDSYYLADGDDGIRHQWINDHTGTPSVEIDAGGDALTDADLGNALAAMDKYAAEPERLRLVTDIGTYLKGLRLLPSVLTVDKYGPNAPILTGELARYMNIPIIISASHRRAEADGKVSATAANNTLGSISIFHSGMWYVGFKRGLLIEGDRSVRTRQIVVVASFRQAVACRGTRSDVTHTAGIRNIL